MQDYLSPNLNEINTIVPKIVLPIKLKETIKDVNSFPKIKNGKIYFFDTKKNLAIYDESALKEEKKITLLETAFPKEIIDMVISKDHLLCTVLDDLVIIDLKKDKVIKKEPNSTIDLSICAVSDHKIFGTRLSEEEEPLIFSYDINSCRYLINNDFEELSIGVTTSNDLFFLDNDDGSFFAFNKNTGDLIWNYSLGEIGKYKNGDDKADKGNVSGHSIVYQDCVIIPVLGYVILGLDIKTGDLKWKLKTDVRNPSNFQLANGILHCLSYFSYYEIDPTSGEVLKRLSLDDKVFGKIDFTIPGVLTITSSHLIAIDGFTGVMIALNKATGEVDFQYKFKAGVPLKNPPLIINDRLYVLDVEKNLHVFTVQ